MTAMAMRQGPADGVRRAAFQAYWLLRIGFSVVAIAPTIGAPLVALWLGGIIVNLLTAEPPEYYDIALRDFGLMLGALTLTRLAWAFAPLIRKRAQPAGERPAERSLRPHRAA